METRGDLRSLQQAFSTHNSSALDNSSGEIFPTSEKQGTEPDSDRDQFFVQNSITGDQIFESFAPQPDEG